MINEYGTTYYVPNKWRLPFHWDDLTINEAIFILEKLHEKLLDELTTEADKTICRLLLVGFWAGRPVNEVLGFHFMQQRPNDPKHEGIYRTSKESSFIFHIPGPDLKENKFASGESTIKTTTQIQLKIPDSLLMSLEPYLCELSQSKRRQSLFKLDASDLSKKCDEMVRMLRDKRFKRITPERLTRFIPLMIELSDGSESATTGLILGYNDANRTSRDSYTTLRKSPLVRIYEALSREIENHLSYVKEPMLLNTAFSPKKSSEDREYLGSPFRPSQEALQSFVKNLKKKIQKFNS